MLHPNNGLARSDSFRRRFPCAICHRSTSFLSRMTISTTWARAQRANWQSCRTWPMRDGLRLSVSVRFLPVLAYRPTGDGAQLDGLCRSCGDRRHRKFYGRLPSRHFSGRSLFNRFETLWASFAIVGPTHRVYYGSDSGEWPGFAEIAADLGPFDLTMLEIGASIHCGQTFTWGLTGAARSFKAMGSQGLLMPIHWGLFDLALHAWRQPIQRILTLADEDASLKIWSPLPGVPTDVQADRPLRQDWWS